MAPAGLDTLLRQLVDETTQKSLCHFAPELAISVTIIVLLLMRLLWSLDRWIPPYFTALAGSLTAVILSGTQLMDVLSDPSSTGSFFSGLLVYDHFGCFVRAMLALFLVLVIALTVLSGVPDREDGPDFYSLLLGASLGMMMMASTNHMLMFFIGVEMASVPGYALVAFLKGRKQSSEAAFKYVVYGAGAAGVMLYGISLLTGLLGTAQFPELADRVGLILGNAGGIGDATARTLLLAILMVLTGLFFKLSIVPFHFWCPDAFEGASAEVAGFLSVASKGAAFALLVRFCTAIIPAGSTEIFTGLGVALGVLATVTVTFGNLAAYSQTNVKRLLAYSTIAHAGYMLMAVSAMVVALSGGKQLTGFDSAAAAIRCVEGLLFYLFVYLFMNLGAFSVVALIRNQTFREDIASYRGIGWQAPMLCSCMILCVFSLVGLPPLGGFWGKLVIFSSLFDLGRVHWFMWAMLAIGGLNTVFSLVYYIRILKAMFIESGSESARPVEMPSHASQYALLISLPVLLLGLLPSLATQLAHDVAARFLQ